MLKDDSALRGTWAEKLAAPVLLLALTALLYLPGTGTIPLMDRDEPRFAHATVEMMQQGEWVLPYFNSNPAETDAQRVARMHQGKTAMDVGFRFDKPPLTYWWMRLHYALLGVNELAARLHSVVATWLVSLVIFAMGQRLGGRTAAWWGAVGWLTSFQALVHGRLCVADMPMVLCVALTMWSLSELMGAEEKPARFGRWWWLLWLSLGLGFLAKGPIALLVPALAVALWRFVFWRKPLPWSRLQAGLGGLLAFGVVAAWGIPALLQTEGMFWKVGMGEHVVQRGTQAFNGRVIIPGYYLLTAFLSLLPGIVFLPQVVAYARQRWTAQTALLVAWFAAPQVVFFLYATQLPHYTMPGFPAFFVLLGLAMKDAPAGVSRFARWLLGGFAALALAVLAVVWCGKFEILAGLRTVFTCVAVILGTLAALGFAASWRSGKGLALSCVALAVALVFMGQDLRAMHPAVQLAPTLRALPEKSRLVALQFMEPSLVFYANKPWSMYSNQARVEDKLAKGRADAFVLLVREWTLADWLKHYLAGTPQPPTKDFTKEVEALTAQAQGFNVQDVRGLNLARSSWAEVRLLTRVQPSP
ncbi:MAG: ArnT family glycosyltransferase [Roseimicrobium sp.]